MREYSHPSHLGWKRDELGVGSARTGRRPHVGYDLSVCEVERVPDVTEVGGGQRALEVAEILLEASAENEEGGLGLVEAGEVFEFGNLRVNLLGKEDSPGALRSDTRPQHLHPVPFRYNPSPKFCTCPTLAAG